MKPYQSEYSLTRCYAHIMNLILKNKLKDCDDTIMYKEGKNRLFKIALMFPQDGTRVESIRNISKSIFAIGKE